MSFKKEECIIPGVWCGNGPIKDADKNKYSKAGTPYECMKKGFGAGYHTERAKHLPATSLENIKYVGEVYDSNFRDEGIYTISQLVTYAQRHTKQELDDLLARALIKKNKVIDERAWNSVLVYLNDKGIADNKLPACKKI